MLNGFGNSDGSLTVYTRQVTEVWDTLSLTGVYRVQRAYIRKKNDSISDYYLKLYEWYTREAGKYLRIPDGAQYPIWFSVSEDQMLQPVEGTVILKAELPAGTWLLANYDAWGYVVNYWYVPLDERDAAAHQRELRTYGIASDDELLLTDKGNFYPLLKRKLLDSWKRVFTLAPGSAEGIVATSWELRREWVREVRRSES